MVWLRNMKITFKSAILFGGLGIQKDGMNVLLFKLSQPLYNNKFTMGRLMYFDLLLYHCASQNCIHFGVSRNCIHFGV